LCEAPFGPFRQKTPVPFFWHAKLFEDETIPAPETLHDDWKTREPLRTGQCEGTKLINMHWGQDIYRALMASAPKENRPRTAAVYQQMIKGYMRLVASLDENVGSRNKGKPIPADRIAERKQKSTFSKP